MRDGKRKKVESFHTFLIHSYSYTSTKNSNISLSNKSLKQNEHKCNLIHALFYKKLFIYFLFVFYLCEGACKLFKTIKKCWFPVCISVILLFYCVYEMVRREKSLHQHLLMKNFIVNVARQCLSFMIIFSCSFWARRTFFIEIVKILWKQKYGLNLTSFKVFTL